MKRWLRRLLIGVGALLGLLVVVIVGAVVYIQLTWDRPYDRPVRQLAASKDPRAIARGEYIFKYTALCWGCHGAEEDINALPAGSQEFDLRKVGPPGGFGIFYGANLTPDRETGIGAWSDGEIVRALREGIDREGRVLTLMPFEWYRGMSDEDLLAIAAYIRSLPSTRNPVAPNRPSFTYRALITFKLVKPQPPDTGPVTAPAPGPTVEYGKYLSSHLSSCAECHTPRNLSTGQFFMDRPFTGGSLSFSLGAGVATPPKNLTPDRETGIGNWNEDQFLTAIRTGVRPDGRVIMPAFMPWLIYRELSDDDLHAIYRYLRSLPATPYPGPTQVVERTSAATRGEALYQGYCAPCHGKEGGGTFISRIPLRQVAQAAQPPALERTIKEGVAGTLMPGFARTFNSQDLAALLQFLRTWGGQ